jgi:hypothetical protein
MARYAANAPTNFELPAPVCVGALLVAGALTKVDHPQWAIGATIFFYVIHLAAQWIKRGASSTRCGPIARHAECLIRREYSASPEHHVIGGQGGI